MLENSLPLLIHYLKFKDVPVPYTFAWFIFTSDNAYLWVGHRQGVQIQILATLIFYTVLNRLVPEVAIALNQSKEKILVEMVFHSLYYVAKAVTRGENPDVVSYLAERAKLFGLVKAERKRHRERDALSQHNKFGGLFP